MSVESTLNKEMAEYGEMLLWRWDPKNPNYERGDDTPTTKEETARATILLFPDASDTQVSEMVSMGHGMSNPEEIAEIREDM